MKLTQLLRTMAGGFGLAMLLSSCQSTGDRSDSNTHEMGGPRTPRMDNSVMPNRGSTGSTSSDSGSSTHEMGGPRTPRMDDSVMPGRN